jgi:hypothetical protein
MRPINRTQRRSFQQTPSAPARETTARVPSEFFRELQSAASMIMSPEECAALEQEFAMLQRPRSVIAA